MKTKEEKIKEFAISIIENPEHKKEINNFMEKLNLKKEEVIKSFIQYDTDVLEYDNSIYESISLRAGLYLHYLLKGSWHEERQGIISQILKQEKVKNIADIGFGAPTKYIKEYVLENKDVKLTLFDLYDSAFKFAEVILEYWDGSYREQIKFKKTDMNTYEYVGDYDLYIFQDSIEHVNDPSKYFKMIIDSSPKNSKFLLSLPICPPIPSHNIFWKTKEDAKVWLNKLGLFIEVEKEVHVNPKVDLFAEDLDELFNYVVLCSKK